MSDTISDWIVTENSEYLFFSKKVIDKSGKHAIIKSQNQIRVPNNWKSAYRFQLSAGRWRFCTYNCSLYRGSLFIDWIHYLEFLKFKKGGTVQRKVKLIPEVASRDLPKCWLLWLLFRILDFTVLFTVSPIIKGTWGTKRQIQKYTDLKTGFHISPDCINQVYNHILGNDKLNKSNNWQLNHNLIWNCMK